MKNCGNSTGSHNYKHSFKLIFFPKTKRAIFKDPFLKTTVYYKNILALAGWLNWLERYPIHQKVVGLFPGQAHILAVFL